MFRIFDGLQLALERLWNNRILVMWALVGLTAATTLALSLPLYVDAVDTRLLTSRLPDPPYAFRYRYLGSWKGNIKQADVDSATAEIQHGFASTIGLPVKMRMRFTAGGAWSTRLGTNKILGPFSIGTLEGADKLMKIEAGKWSPAPTKAGDPLPVMIPEKMMNSMGVQVGDSLTSSSPSGKPLSLKVVAMWTPINANDPSWIFTPKFFDEILLVQPSDLPA